MTKPPANVLNLPLEQRAEMALKAAVERVIVEHARQGLPIYIWRDGRVVGLIAAITNITGLKRAEAALR